MGLIIAGGAAAQSSGPYPLTASELDALLSSDRVWFGDGGHASAGAMAVSLVDATWGRLHLAVRADRRLNLKPKDSNDLMSAFGGELLLTVDAVLNPKGRNLYDATTEPARDGKVFLQPGESGALEGTREVPLLKEAKLKDIRAVSGSWQLDVPVDIVEVELRIPGPGPLTPSPSHPWITGASLEGQRLKLIHPRPLTREIITVLGFDANGARVRVLGFGFGGAEPDNHHYDFRRPVASVRIWIAGSFVQRQVPFSINRR